VVWSVRRGRPDRLAPLAVPDPAPIVQPRRTRGDAPAAPRAPARQGWARSQRGGVERSRFDQTETEMVRNSRRRSCGDLYDERRL